MQRSVWIYIFVMFGVSYLLRVLPLTLIRGKIKNRFVNSLLYYLPYVTLAVMTFPAILEVSENPVCGLAALIAACVTAWFSENLFASAVVACLAVLIVSLI